MKSLCVSLVFLLLTGCAHYEYQLIDPAQSAGHIGSKADYVVKLEPLEYRFRAVEGRLVVQIHNPTDQTIQLKGNESYVVDLNGQSHPLRSLSIAADSFGKVIIPPPRPEVYDTGPRIGFGVGVTHVGMVNDARYLEPDPLINRPRYLAVYDEEDSYYWDICGEGELRVRFTYQRADKTFSDDFRFRRMKM